VDDLGGVNVQYYQYVISTLDPQGNTINIYEPRYLRITGFASGNPTLFKESLGPAFGIRNGDDIADYDHIACAGCHVYTVHMRRDVDEDGTSYYNVYCNHVRVAQTCGPENDIPADVNSDQIVNAADLALFTSWFAAGDPRADLNQDNAVDAADFALFHASCRP
jgi:hypothetical protein